MSGADFSLTTFSRSGKLVQIEYALNAVEKGKTALGIKGACAPAGEGGQVDRTQCTARSHQRRRHRHA
jgi:hypothetical protein